MQTEQEAKLVFQYLAIYINENLPKIIQIVPKWVQKLCKIQNEPLNMANDFSICC